jgi:co-chaperonin GroES (HSP10)
VADLTWLPLPGRVAVVEQFEASPWIHRVDGYDATHERDRKCHRGRVVAMGPPASTRLGVAVPPGFAIGDSVLYVLAKNSDMYHGEGSWKEEARMMIWPPTDERVTWIAQEEVIGVFATIAFETAAAEAIARVAATIDAVRAR